MLTNTAAHQHLVKFTTAHAPEAPVGLKSTTTVLEIVNQHMAPNAMAKEAIIARSTGPW